MATYENAEYLLTDFFGRFVLSYHVCDTSESAKHAGFRSLQWQGRSWRFSRLESKWASPQQVLRSIACCTSHAELSLPMLCPSHITCTLVREYDDLVLCSEYHLIISSFMAWPPCPLCWKLWLTCSENAKSTPMQSRIWTVRDGSAEQWYNVCKFKSLPFLCRQMCHPSNMLDSCLSRTWESPARTHPLLYTGKRLLLPTLEDS